MDIQKTAGVAVMAASLQQSTLGSSLIDKTLDKMNGADAHCSCSCGSGGMDVGSQKEILSAAYASQGKGTKLDTVA